MIGIGARKGLPVLVTIPQLVGGGAVGLAIGDSLSTTARAERVAAMLGGADVIIESAVALTQEVHDGPFELYTGHGLWAAWQGQPIYSLKGKTLLRIDLDPALEQVWQEERRGSAVQEAIDKGLPKTKLFEVPFRMEMSGFARLEGSLPVVGDIGVIWPILALRVAERLGLTLEFLSYPQHTPQGQAMREWIVEAIRPVSRRNVLEGLGSPRSGRTNGWRFVMRAAAASVIVLAMLSPVACGEDAAPVPRDESKTRVVKNLDVYHEEGRFAGWPANHGAWSWGNEILVGFEVGYFRKKLAGSRDRLRQAGRARAGPLSGRGRDLDDREAPRPAAAGG